MLCGSGLSGVVPLQSYAFAYLSSKAVAAKSPSTPTTRTPMVGSPSRSGSASPALAIRGNRVSGVRQSTVATAVAAPETSTSTLPIFAEPGTLAADKFVRPSAEELKDIVMYGELAQVTYDSFRNKVQAAKVLGTPRFGDSGFEQRYKEESMGQLVELLQPNSLARKRNYKIIDYLYANSGWYFDDLERAVQQGIGNLIQKAGKDKSPDNKSVGRWLQEQYNWIGYVAVSQPEKGAKQDIAIVFRGTITSTEWVADFDCSLINAAPWAKGTSVDGQVNEADQEPEDTNREKMPAPKEAKICRGFKKIYAKPSEFDPDDRRPPQAQIHQDMDYIFERYKEKFNIGTITCVGHSLGAALATLAGYDLAQSSCVPNDVAIRVCNFEGPKVGDEDFVANFRSLPITIQRVVNVRDVVPSVPGLSKVALSQISEAMQKAGKKAVGLDKAGDPDHVHKTIKELLRDAGRVAAVEVAEFVQTIAAWKHNPFMGPLLGSFFHVCDAIAIDTSSSHLAKLIKQPADFSGAHNLEMVLHMLDPSRDSCLINKGGDILLNAAEECKNWWATSQDIVPPTCPEACHWKK